jgi:hypothetical protein
LGFSAHALPVDFVSCGGLPDEQVQKRIPIILIIPSILFKTLAETSAVADNRAFIGRPSSRNSRMNPK